MTRKRLIVICAGAAAFFASAAFVAFILPEKPRPLEALHGRSDIEELFTEFDAGEAYAMFVERNKMAPSSDQHAYAHIAGEALYGNTGIEGFAVCSADFGFGCFHSFIPLALAEHGEDVVRRLDEACVAAYGPLGLGCAHGLGHGALAYYGYGEDAIGQALELCADLTWQEPYGGCQDGAFMEYNDRTMEPEARVRPFVLAKRHEPCSLLGARFQQSCYFSQAGWWDRSLQNDTEASRKLAQWCKEAEGADSPRACFRGLGYMFVTREGLDVGAGGALCDALSSDKEGMQWCREGVAWALFAHPPTRDSAEQACEVLDEPHAQSCLENYLFTIQ